MKKIFSLIVAFSVVLFFACNKSSIPELVHDSHASEQLQGMWEQCVPLEIEISMNPDNPTEVSGTVRSNSITTLSFEENQNFTIETKMEFVSYEPKNPSEEVSVSLDAMKEYFSQKVLVQGLYIVTESVIQYDNRLVTMNETSEFSFEEFASMNPDAGTQIQTAAWRLDGDTLYLTVVGNELQSDLVYTRVK